ncbi:MAG: DUF4126 family protein [Acidobacteriota bacterium]
MTLGIILTGLSAGLRAFTPPAVITWCAYLGCLNLDATPFAFMSSPISVAILSLFAVGEYVGDLLPIAPNRTDLLGLLARVATGAFSAACLLAANGNSMTLAIIGSAAAVVGAYGGYHARVRLVKALGVNDAFVAIPEDLIAIAISIVSVGVAAS